ncbi:uncharacterized protein LOC126953012 [Macaca thibetana thibetana]|uniref:uncharacterized protein LOC126953012 n=1 Tax=Macaca thibetana thibetana TaxID=257877 RepID=UPI0021BCB880|nr:uncharacterized protein LOC126953012 [Macaca thibetana thibetana]
MPVVGQRVLPGLAEDAEAASSPSDQGQPALIRSPVPWTPSLRPPCSSPRRSQAPPPLPCLLPPPLPASPRPFPQARQCCPRYCLRSPQPRRPRAPAPPGAQASTQLSPPPRRPPRVWSSGFLAAPRPPLPAHAEMTRSGRCPSWHRPRARKGAAPRAPAQRAGRRAPWTRVHPRRPAPGPPLWRAWRPTSGTSWWSCGP